LSDGDSEILGWQQASISLRIEQHLDPVIREDGQLFNKTVECLLHESRP
jgi:hypothetical protein